MAHRVPRWDKYRIDEGFDAVYNSFPELLYQVEDWLDSCFPEVPRVLFLGVCLDFYYCLRRVLVP
ncbi:hypothetical protein QP904_11635, partial [Corynebacterium kefirresidentii]|uniref:hypothetical protein n=1 Tax=Corynebacterium sp. MSK185 TaxID=3377092 RepID=UPI00254FA2D5